MESLQFIYFVFTSVVEGPGNDEVLPVLGEGRRLGVDAELRHYSTQQSLITTTLHSQRQLRPQVSRTDNRKMTMFQKSNFYHVFVAV